VRKYIYITGYGRSGSTILELALTDHIDKSMGLGEVRYVHDVEHSHKHCSCGSMRSNCRVWGNKSLDATIGNFNAELNRIFVVTGNVRNYMDKVFADLHELNGDSIDVVIDSSKNTYGALLRPLKLLLCSNDVYVIYIKRRLRGVVSSLVKGRNKHLILNVDESVGYYSVMKSIFHYFICNTVNAFLLMHPRVVYLSYEKFVSLYEKELPRVIQFSGLEMSKPPARELTLEKSHLISGNRLSKSNNITVSKQT